MKAISSISPSIESRDSLLNNN